jgi:hypothetical protein
MERFIVIPIYDHTDDSELAEIFAELSRLGFSNQPYLSSSEKLPEHSAWGNASN